jgi:uncharacterized protein YutD
MPWARNEASAEDSNQYLSIELKIKTLQQYLKKYCRMIEIRS